jgi:hypothetical protein
MRLRALSEGCETSKCQTTAWNASAWGVTRSAFTVGTITTASATVAVNPPSRPTMPQILAPDLFGVFHRADEIHAGIFLDAAAADAEDHDQVVSAKSALASQRRRRFPTLRRWCGRSAPRRCRSAHRLRCRRFCGKSLTACEALAALPPTPRKKTRPPALRVAARSSAVFSIARRPMLSRLRGRKIGQIIGQGNAEAEGKKWKVHLPTFFLGPRGQFFASSVYSMSLTIFSPVRGRCRCKCRFWLILPAKSCQGSQTAEKRRPVMPSLAEEARKRTRFGGFVGRCAAGFFLLEGLFIFAARRPGRAARTSSNMRVFIAPGATQLTSMPVPGSSWASVSLKRTRALWRRVGGKIGRGETAPPPERLMILPQPCCPRIVSINCWQIRAGAKKFISNTRATRQNPSWQTGRSGLGWPRC